MIEGLNWEYQMKLKMVPKNFCRCPPLNGKAELGGSGTWLGGTGRWEETGQLSQLPEIFDQFRQFKEEVMYCKSQRIPLSTRQWRWSWWWNSCSFVSSVAQNQWYLDSISICKIKANFTRNSVLVGPELENGEIEEWHKDEHAKANQIEDCSCQDRALQLNPSWTCVSVEICQVMSEGGTGQKRYLKKAIHFHRGQKNLTWTALVFQCRGDRFCCFQDWTWRGHNRTN